MIIFKNVLIDELIIEADTASVELCDCKITTVTVKEPEKAVPVEIEED